jgi:CheY-like chemotaxis protein
MRPFRILVVDDNHLIRGLLGMILEGAGYVPVHAESGEVALELARADPPDLCFVDEAMPGMTGSELITALRRAPERRLAMVPVIGISGRAEAAQELLAAGANAFVPKPIEEGAVLSAVDRVLRPPVAGSPAGASA